MTVDTKKQNVIQIINGIPPKSAGYNGAQRMCFVSGKGLYHAIFFKGRWYLRLYRPYSQTLEQEINQTVQNITVDGVVDHDDLSNVTANQHHPKSHAHDGADGSGTVAHGDTTGQNPDDHHDPVTVPANSGLNRATQQLNVDLNDLSAAAVDVANDSFAIVDATDNGSKQEAIADLITAIAGDGLKDSAGVINIEPNDFAGAGLQDDSFDDLEVIYEADNPQAVLPDNTASDGTVDEAARGDHVHGVTVGTPVNVDLSANAEGTANSFARSDHKHDLDESIAPTWTSEHVFNQAIYVNNPYDRTLGYGITIQNGAEGQSMMTGEADLKSNHSTHGFHVLQSTSYETNYGAW